MGVCCLTTAPSLVAEDFTYVVRPGDNPWTLTERYLKSFNYWPRVQDYNNILDPTAIRPGTKLLIPVGWMRGVAAVAQVTDLRGGAELRRGANITPLKLGLTISVGDVVRTGPGSTLTLEFPDGSRSLVGPDSELRMADLARLRASAGQQVHIELQRGQLENDVSSIRKGSGRFVIETPAAVAAVRGTRFRVTSSSQEVRSETLHGEVVLQNPAGKAILRAGNGSLAQLGKTPARPIALLPGPKLDHLPARVERVPLDLEFPALPGALSYRTQLAPSAGFSVVVDDQISTAPRARSAADLPDGRYRLRVRAIDRHGLEGLDAEREIEVDACPEPPLPSQPAADGIVVVDNPEFRWAGSGEGAHYRFQLANDAAFGSLLLDADQLEEPHLTLTKPLPPGQYFWRVALHTTSEGQGPFSDAQRFRRPPPGPLPEPPRIGSDTLELRWRAGTDGSYQVQISSDATFAQPQVDRQTSEVMLSVDKPPAGVHYVRVRAVQAGKPPGAWGKPQQVEIPHDYWRALSILIPALLILAL
ncbi:MAG: FecR domain-containing protein [Candidatus Accumulibacter phosphatis]|uniref:FecR domain-containing protein n=1 Tax=Candidatus Accumulibacter phosphatis TaxID=327160 RepID=UPI001A42A8A7|nr:FecR domain-containing protein [Candidatus Accumulibacter phosphatis]